MRLVLILAAAAASMNAGDLSNPFEGSERARRAGAKLFARDCASCHGASLEGRGKTPSLDRPAIYGAPPEALFRVLRDGYLYSGMPSFAHLPEPQRWQIITFLQARARTERDMKK